MIVTIGAGASILIGIALAKLLTNWLIRKFDIEDVPLFEDEEEVDGPANG